MIPQFSNSALSSFLFYSEDRLLSKGEAYINYTSKLYYTPDSTLNGYIGYSAPFKQWVYNQNITGANIINSISGSINLSANQSGMKIDYENGRVLVPSSFGTGLNISGSYAFKELNFYQSTETEEALLTQNKYALNSRFISQAPRNGIEPHTQVTPAIFINTTRADTNAFALGGLQNTEISISAIILAETQFQLDAVLDIFSESKDKCFPQLSVYDDPIDEYGSVKTTLYPSGYNYGNIISEKGTPGNLFYVNDVYTSKVSDNIKFNPRLYVGMADVTISKARVTT